MLLRLGEKPILSPLVFLVLVLVLTHFYSTGYSMSDVASRRPVGAGLTSSTTVEEQKVAAIHLARIRP